MKIEYFSHALYFFILLLLGGCAVSRGGFEYTIKKGDTISALSKKYDITNSDIIKFNKNVTPEKLIPGKIIYIPSNKEISLPDSNLSVVEKKKKMISISR